MTREEAIENLKGCVCSYEVGDEGKPNGNVTADLKQETIDMAIQALEQESKTGHWIYTLEDWNKWECSECGFTKRTDVHVSIGYNYCPNCGAKMESNKNTGE